MNKSKWLMVLVVWAILPGVVLAASVTGKIVGRHCAEAGTVCPVDRLDPHIQLEKDFVLVQPDGHVWLLPNISRDLKVRHVLDSVEVTGAATADGRAIQVDEFRVKTADGYVTVWSHAMLEQERQARCESAKIRLAKAGDSTYEKPEAWKAVRRFCQPDG